MLDGKTPFMLSRMATSKGKTLRKKIGLLENNARVAAQIAWHFVSEFEFSLKNLEALKALLEEGAEGTQNKRGLTALCRPLPKALLNIVRALVLAGDDLNPPRRRLTALDFA